MDIDIIAKGKLTIKDLGKGEIFTWADKPSDAFMVVEGEGIICNDSYKHAVNLRTGGVIEPGIACNVLRIATTKITSTVIY